MRSPAALLAALLVAAIGLTYANAFTGPFVLDDELSIRDNPHVRELWPPSHWLSLEPQSSVSGRPLVTLSFALCHAVGGLDVRVFHAVNVALHVLNAVLLLALLRFHLALGTAFAAALLWGLHPLNTEAVNYVTQRSELGMAAFYLGTMVAVTRERRGVAVLCCALGMACKESMVTAPVAVLLWERVYRFASWRELFARTGAFYAALAGTWLVLLGLMLLAPRSASVGFNLNVTALDYALSQLGAIAEYLRLSMWPHPLALYYGPAREVAFGEVIVPGLFLLGAAAAAVVLFVRSPRAGYPALLFFLLLAPTSSVVPIATEVAAERRMYLPLAALIALAVGAAAPVLARRVPVRVTRGAVAALVAAVASVTWARNAEYADAVTLWQSAVRAKPELAQAHVNLGIAYAEQGRYVEAAQSYRDALQLAPKDARARFDLALALAPLGDSAGAIAELERAVALDPRFEAAQLALARARAATGDRARAARDLRKALDASHSPALRIELAQVLLAMGDATSQAEALAQASRAASEGGERDPGVLHTLAAAEWAAGRRTQALATQARALELAAGGPPQLRAQLADQLERYRAALAR